MTQDPPATLVAYWQRRLAEADAITPRDQLALVAQLRRELAGESDDHPGMSRVPLLSGSVVRVPATSPLIVAALAGRKVSVAGSEGSERAVARPSLARLQDASLPVKVGALALPLLLALVALFFVATSGGEAATAVTPTPSPTATLTVTPTPSPTVSPTAPPTLAPVVAATPTAYSVALLTGAAAPSGNDPASVEVAGFSFILSRGEVGTETGIWQPEGAEWLAGTSLRRVVAVPYAADLATAVAALRPGTVVRLRLRSGEIVRYRVQEVTRRPRQQIEVLAGRSPSLALLLHSEPTSDRWVLVAEAIQSPTDFASYEAAPLTLPTPALPLTTTTLVTSTRILTHPTASLVLTVGDCTRSRQLGLVPAPEAQQFLTCEVTLAALPDASGPVAYDGSTMALTEAGWLAGRLDWWPGGVPVRGALRAGTLLPGERVTGRVAGLVQAEGGSPLEARSAPLLLWEQAGQRIEVRLTDVP